MREREIKIFSTSTTSAALNPNYWASVFLQKSWYCSNRDRTTQAWIRALETKSLYEVEHRLRAADGSYKHFWVRAVPVLAARGGVREWVGTHTDISAIECKFWQHRESQPHSIASKQPSSKKLSASCTKLKLN